MTLITTISQPMKYGLHIVVTWPGTPLPILRKVCWMVSMTVLLVYQYGYVIKHLKSNTLIEIVDNLSICMPFSLVFVKLCIAWTHPSLFNEILQTMEEESQKYAVLDTNNFISKAAHLSYRSTSFVIYMYMIATVFYILGAFVSQEADSTTSRELLLKMDLPFDTKESPIYELIVSLQSVYQASTAYTFAIFNALPLMIVLHIGCQIDIMCQTLIKVPYENKKQLIFFISRHQEIITFADRIEKLFTYMALTQLLSNTLLICCLGYIIVIAIQTDNGFALLIKCALFYVVICLELFIYCFAGEYLNIKSQLICDTAYKFLWYNIHQNETRLLILVILRSQRGFTLTFGKFANLSMESFMAIMKASASYISVLLAMT
ncbi:odorant receptor 4-like [Xylocopa sonorina]|uniref:odorant receptor 4-like n=1 Tax=Xylocopa sonorina TaxID=1818115 RepID=UPI00403AF437